MALLIVSYDLPQEGQQYDRLEAAIEELGESRRLLETFWILRTSESALVVKNRLSEHLDSNDKLVVFAAKQADWSVSGLADDEHDFVRKHLNY